MAVLGARDPGRGTGAPGARTRLSLASRVAAALLGGYAFAWGLIATATSGLYALGMGFHDAEFLATMLGVLAFLAAFLWTFAVRRVRTAWLLLAGGGGVLAAVGSLVQASLL